MLREMASASCKACAGVSTRSARHQETVPPSVKGDLFGRMNGKFNSRCPAPARERSLAAVEANESFPSRFANGGRLRTEFCFVPVPPAGMIDCMQTRNSALILWAIPLLALVPICNLAAQLKVGVFDVDATPPVGSALMYDTMTESSAPLRAKGIVLTGAEQPIVLCAVDWIGIANEGQDEWRKALAEAAQTEVERVTVTTLHQHDAPMCDFLANRILAEHGLDHELFDTRFARRVIAETAGAVERALVRAREVSHLGLGMAQVEKVASNRRIMGADGKVRSVRWTACREAELREEPAGTIDPMLRMISFWSGEEPLAVLTYYATHPQSYYRTGNANPDFPGMARMIRQHTLEVPHIHFNGAGGNIGAGKWNDGSPENRGQLAWRLAEGMRAAWENTEKRPIRGEDVSWRMESVRLPPRSSLEAASAKRILEDETASVGEKKSAAMRLAWLERCAAGKGIDIPMLQLGPARVLHLPGEPAVEYQLAAQGMRPDLFVAVAGYTDYGPGYICLEEHYSQGGYEDSERASRVDPDVEAELDGAMRRLLGSEALPPLIQALRFYSSFDQTLQADLANGDGQLYWAPSMDQRFDGRPGLPEDGSVERVPERGRLGGALRFHRKSSARLFYQGQGNVPYAENNWSGTVSFWLRLSPVEDLETGFCDPVQITPRAWNDAAFFVEFENREGRAPFRLGVYSDYNVWNPEDREWAEIPFDEKPLLEVEENFFSRSRWTHVAFVWQGLNVGGGGSVSTARLYVDGKDCGAISGRDLRMDWQVDRVLIMMGLNYVGFFDELSVFDRALKPAEIRWLQAEPDILKGNRFEELSR